MYRYVLFFAQQSIGLLFYHLGLQAFGNLSVQFQYLLVQAPHLTAHLGSKGIALFGSHTTPFKVSIERENFKAIQAPELSKLSVEKVFEKLSEIIS